MPPKADSNKMAAAQLDAVFDAFVKFLPIGGEGDGRMVKKTGAVWGPILEELAKTMPAVIQGISPETSSQAKCDADKVRSQPRTRTTDLGMHNPFRANATSRG
jgi:hypothetical protein